MQRRSRTWANWPRSASRPSSRMNFGSSSSKWQIERRLLGRRSNFGAVKTSHQPILAMLFQILGYPVGSRDGIREELDRRHEPLVRLGATEAQEPLASH